MIAAVSHDAGGAEILSSYVRRSGLECLFVLAGPARKIFERKLGEVNAVPLDEALLRADSILCGTSWPSSFEWNAMKQARVCGKRSVAILDHWMNYGVRFTREGETCLPDELWVGDAEAEKLARSVFPTTKLTLVENPYFLDIREELAGARGARNVGGARLAVLYVCEPKSAQGPHSAGATRQCGYSEVEALRYFLRHLAALGKPVESIVIRPHPSEAPDKYDWALREFDLPISRGGKEPLCSEIGACDVVVGCESMALVIGLLAGKRVITSIPPGGLDCILPQPQIESLRRLVGE